VNRIGDGLSGVDDKMPDAIWRHDLKNQLGIMLGYSELILQELDQSNPLRADVEEILKAVQRALTLVGQIKSGA
jgi:signal transduction histidine kinase